VLFRCRQDKNSVGGRLFQRLQKGVEGRCAQHVHLIDDIDLVLAGLWRKPHLLYQRPDIVYGIVAGSIQLMDVHGDPIVERDTGMALVTGFPICAYILTVNGLGKYTGAGRFTDPPGTAEQKCMRQLIVLDGILKGSRNMRLPHHCRKTLWPVFSRRNNKFVH